MLSLVAGALALESYHFSRGISGIKSRRCARVPLPRPGLSGAPTTPVRRQPSFLESREFTSPLVPLASYVRTSRASLLPWVSPLKPAATWPRKRGGNLCACARARVRVHLCACACAHTGCGDVADRNFLIFPCNLPALPFVAKFGGFLVPKLASPSPRCPRRLETNSEQMPSSLSADNSSKWPSAVPDTGWASNSAAFIFFCWKEGQSEKGLYHLLPEHPPSSLQHIPLALGWGAVVGKAY